MASSKVFSTETRALTVLTNAKLDWMTICEIFDSAIQLHEAGRLDEAEGLYIQIVIRQPEHSDALHGLGVIAHQIGRNDLAVELFKRSIMLNPKAAHYYNNLGNAFKALGQVGDAIIRFREALDIKPDYAEAYNNLGIALKNQGQWEEAIGCYQQAWALKPDLAEAQNNLGVLFKDQGRLDEAVECYKRALAVKLDYAEAYSNLGIAIQEQGRLEEAVMNFERALALKPKFIEGHINLGIAFKVLGRFNEAIACFEQAIAIKTTHAEAHLNLGAIFKDLGRLDDAIFSYQRALNIAPGFSKAYNNLGIALTALGKLDEATLQFQQALSIEPNSVDALNNLGIALKDQGRLDEALASFMRASDLAPGLPGPSANAVYLLHFHPGYDTSAITQACRQWNQMYAAHLAQFVLPHPNDRNPERKLRIGYLSPNFCSHPVGRFLLPLIEQHDRGNFEIFAYAQVKRPDAVTDRFQLLMEHWRNTFGLSDAQLCDQIREDEIDILIDLTMHMAENRLLVFARKPAPVQATWLAYCSSTGLNTMDYRFSDPYLDPETRDETLYSEQTIRLPETYWCYQPTGIEPETGLPPSSKNGFITFGCLNNFAKVTSHTILTWIKIIQVVPKSCLLIHAAEGSHRLRFLGEMERSGIDAQRVQFVGKLPIKKYFGFYQEIDIALDPFPYAGGTTTCDALWMGVPLVSLAGETAVARGGLSILSNLGLEELVAWDSDQYIQIAVNLAMNLPRLIELRKTLRSRIQESPLMDAPRFARQMEAAYRMMWRKWCRLIVE